MVDDVARFLVIFFIVLAAFACCCTQIYSSYSPSRLRDIDEGKYCLQKAIEYQNLTRDNFNECSFIHLAKLTLRNSYDKNRFYRKCFNDRKLRLPFVVQDSENKDLDSIFGDQFWDDFCRNPQAIVKQAKSGKRCGDWRKFKCKMEFLANERDSQFVSHDFLKECYKFKNYNEEYFDENTKEMDCQQWYEDLRIPSEGGSGWCRGDEVSPKGVEINLPSLEILQTSVSKEIRSYNN